MTSSLRTDLPSIVPWVFSDPGPPRSASPRPAPHPSASGRESVGPAGGSTAAAVAPPALGIGSVHDRAAALPEALSRVETPTGYSPSGNPASPAFRKSTGAWVGSVSGTVRKHPLATIGAVIALGAVVARLMG